MSRIFFSLSFILVTLFVSHSISAQTNKTRVAYLYPVKYLDLTIENQAVKMAYMDAAPNKSNGQTFILFHGKNFNGYYWTSAAQMLTEQGYRVIIPDQIGWGKSSKPNIHYSFHLLAANNKKLLDSLGVKNVVVIGHSMGGMLAARFVLMYPQIVSKLVLENPIGLEDYRTFVPSQSFEEAAKTELSATYESYLKYQKSYYLQWKPEYEQYVQAQAEALSQPDFPATARANALTSLMIYEQPVCYEFKNIKTPTLLIIGQADRTIVGKDRVPKDLVNLHGQYPQLGREVHQEIENSELVELPGVGHIPHVQDFADFKKAVVEFLAK